MNTKLPTEFAPAERATPELLSKQSEFVYLNIDPNKVLNAIPEIMLVLNGLRQIVFFNDRLTDFAGLPVEDVIGKRPGELLNCIRASMSESGCGTTEFCRECNAVGAILEAQTGNQSIKECSISTVDGNAFDLQVWATPIEFNGKQYTIFCVNDIGGAKRREALEYTFFHDILNTASLVYNYSVLALDPEYNEDQDISLNAIYRGIDQLIEEIKSHRQLLAAEQGVLKPDIGIINSLEFLSSMQELFAARNLDERKTLVVDPRACEIEFESDRVIIRRIINNLIKNALESYIEGGIVTLGCDSQNGEITFYVHNSVFIPRNIQLNIFRRSFSTKGKGRGFGTYSVRLFTELYLKGKVWFDSKPEDGTTFYIKFPHKFPD